MLSWTNEVQTGAKSNESIFLRWDIFSLDVKMDGWFFLNTGAEYFG